MAVSRLAVQVSHHLGACPAELLGDQHHLAAVKIVGDRTGTTAPGVYEAVWQAVARAQTAFVITIGDHIEGGRDAAAEAEWAAVAPVWRAAGAPVWFVAGNHDLWSPASRRVYEKYTGRPATYSFDHGDAHFAVLDNAQSLAVPEAQLDWLEKDLSEHAGAAVKAVFFHQPGWVMPVMLGQTDFRLHRLAKRHGVAAVVSGHTHQYLRRESEGVTYFTVPSAGGHLRNGPDFANGWFYGYTLVDVAGGRLRLHIHELGPPHGQGRRKDSD